MEEKETHEIRNGRVVRINCHTGIRYFKDCTTQEQIAIAVCFHRSLKSDEVKNSSNLIKSALTKTNKDLKNRYGKFENKAILWTYMRAKYNKKSKLSKGFYKVIKPKDYNMRMKEIKDQINALHHEAAMLRESMFNENDEMRFNDNLVIGDKK